MTVLVTGATGFLGRAIVRSLLCRNDGTRVIALLRAVDDRGLEERRRLWAESLPPACRDGADVLRADVTQPRLGLDSSTYAQLSVQIDRVLHVAASTYFGHPLEDARRRNVGSTVEVLRLCRTLQRHGRLARLDYISTAFVAGDRTDVVREDELDVGQGFRNTYEQSKCEAETLCRAAQDELPVTIYRPSIVVGHSQTGATDSYKGLYWPLRLVVGFYDLWRSVLTRMVPLPLRPDCPLDFVPVDYVGAAVATLFHRPEAAGRCYHLAAGTEGTVTIEELVDLGCTYFGVPQLRFADADGRFMRLGRAAHGLGHRLWPRLLRDLELFWPYTLSNPRFDTTSALAVCLRPPRVVEYFPRLLAHAYAHHFGRHEKQPTNRHDGEVQGQVARMTA